MVIGRHVGIQPSSSELGTRKHSESIAIHGFWCRGFTRRIERMDRIPEQSLSQYRDLDLQTNEQDEK